MDSNHFYARAPTWEQSNYQYNTTHNSTRRPSSRHQRNSNASRHRQTDSGEQRQSLLQPALGTSLAGSSAAPPAVRFDETQLAMFASQNPAGLKDELTLAAGRVTPGVDDTPYIQYAIEAVTGGRDEFDPDDMPDRRFDNSNNNHYQGQHQQQEPVGQALTTPSPPVRERTPEMSGIPLMMPETVYGAPHRVSHRASIGEISAMSRTPVSQDEDFRPLSPVSSRALTPFHTAQSEGNNNQQQQPMPIAGPPTRSVPARAGPDLWVPVTRDMRDNFYPSEAAYPPLTYKPRLLRPYSLAFFVLLCLGMVACLIAATVYSTAHDGLTPYAGTIYSGSYFLFRILPQMLAAMILVYAQAVALTAQRILPFTCMASEDARARYLAMFREMYPSSLLWPRGVSMGPWQTSVFSIAAWLALWTVPIASTLFTCILVDGKWTWAPTTGIAWTLVALYLLMAAAGIVAAVFWHRRWTGLMWDPRSIADVVTLLNRSNTTDGYAAADGASTTRTLRDRLFSRWLDRLGYWRTDDEHTGGIWYGIGASGQLPDHEAHMVSELIGKRVSNSSSNMPPRPSSAVGAYSEGYTYLPWCLRTGPLVAYAGISTLLLVALLVVSFVPGTHFEAGFAPQLSARPAQPGAFSAANFLYGFIPSTLGMLLFLLLQGVDQAHRVVAPWAQLNGPSGGVARKTVLAEYAACCHPLEAAFRAARVGHWRVAVVSLAASLAVWIPILAGGLFMALTTQQHQVRMFPSIPVYGVVLALLFIYVGAVTAVVPRRGAARLPHAVTCLAGVVSLCTADELVRDAAFRSVRSRADLEARLGVDPDADLREESAWCFGVVPGRDERRLSVRRLRRFTEKTMSRGYSMV